MIEMELHKIVIDEKRHDQLIVLKEKNGERLLPIVIGINEVSAIKLKLSGVKAPRPITHDLMWAVITGMGGTLEKILIDKLEKNIFYAKLVLRNAAGTESIIDARPSDSIALAVRAHSPIFVDESVLNQMEKFNH